MIEDYFESRSLALFTFVELGSMDAIKELVKLNLGVSILAPWVAQKELGEKSLFALPLGRRKLTRKWGIIHWRDRRLTLAEETFIGLCQSATEQLQTSLNGSNHESA
jgi:DNA-binding transcriptional LysR family regulator